MSILLRFSAEDLQDTMSVLSVLKSEEDNPVLSKFLNEAGTFEFKKWCTHATISNITTNCVETFIVLDILIGHYTINFYSKLVRSEIPVHVGHVLELNTYKIVVEPKNNSFTYYVQYRLI